MDQIVSFASLVMLSLVPYTLASLGIMLGGRAGVFNVATEGIMLAAASVGFIGAYQLGGLIYGILTAVIVGGLFGLAMAYFTTTLKMNQFVIGLAIFFFGLGLSTLVNKLVVGVTLKPPLIPTLKSVPIPALSQIPVVGRILFNHNIMVYIAILLAVGLYYLLYRTSLSTPRCCCRFFCTIFCTKPATAWPCGR